MKKAGPDRRPPCGQRSLNPSLEKKENPRAKLAKVDKPEGATGPMDRITEDIAPHVPRHGRRQGFESLRFVNPDSPTHMCRVCDNDYTS